MNKICLKGVDEYTITIEEDRFYHVFNNTLIEVMRVVRGHSLYGFLHQIS